MKNLSILILLFLFIQTSCVDNKQASNTKNENSLVEKQKNSLLDNLKKEPLLYAKAEDFEYIGDNTSKNLNILTINLSADMNCTSESQKELCQQVLKIIGSEKLIFSSTEEVSITEEFSEAYRMLQKGKVKIGDNSHIADLYYNGKFDNNEARFYGRIIFQLPNITLLRGESVIIEVKGKK